MGNRHSGDNTAEDHVHKDLTTCYTEEPQQKFRLGTVSNK